MPVTMSSSLHVNGDFHATLGARHTCRGESERGSFGAFKSIHQRRVEALDDANSVLSCDHGDVNIICCETSTERKLDGEPIGDVNRRASSVR